MQKSILFSVIIGMPALLRPIYTATLFLETQGNTDDLCHHYVGVAITPYHQSVDGDVLFRFIKKMCYNQQLLLL